MNNKNRPIAIFDSGVGGLSVLREMQRLMPNETYLYFADQIHVPYGPRSKEEISKFSKGIVEFFFTQQVKIIVVACNTASAAALKTLRENFPDTPFVGMEPAIKPAAQNTKSGKIGVLATPTTLQGGLYASVVERFGNDIEIFQNACVGLVEQIELGNLSGVETKQILRDALTPMLINNIDSIVLGCTHYPFVIPSIKEIVGSKITIIDPAPAVARQVRNIGNRLNILRESSSQGSMEYITSGEITKFTDILDDWGFLGNKKSAEWNNSTLSVK
jgi:glutamate racemase